MAFKKTAIVVMTLIVAAFLLWNAPVFPGLFFERVFYREILDSPSFLSSTRILNKYHLDYYEDDLNDISTAHSMEEISRAESNLRDLEKFNMDSLSFADKLSMDVMRWNLETTVAGKPYIQHNYPVNQMFGVQSSLPVFMMSVHQIDDRDDAENYLSRLEKFQEVFTVLLEELGEREKRELFSPGFCCKKSYRK